MAKLTFKAQTHKDEVDGSTYEWWTYPILKGIDVWPEFSLQYIVESIPTQNPSDKVFYNLYIDFETAGEYSEVIDVDEDKEKLFEKAYDHYQKLKKHFLTIGK